MKHEIENCLLVSVTYACAFSLTLGFITPLQQILLPDVPSSIGLLFLPHGVRILAFYYYGWKAIIYLLPVTYLSLALSIKSGVNLDYLSPLVSLIVCYAGFLIASAFITAQPKQPTIKMSHFFILTGALASIFNGLSLSWLHFGKMQLISTLGYFIGDIAGLVVCFLLLIYGFRLARLANAEDSDP